MTCPDCQTAQARPWHGFRVDCPGCAARALSRSPAYVESRRRNSLTRPYRTALEKVGVTHAQVLEAAQTDRIRSEA